MSRVVVRIFATKSDPLARKLAMHLSLENYEVEHNDLDKDVSIKAQLEILGGHEEPPYVLLPSGKVLARPSVGALLIALESE